MDIKDLLLKEKNEINQRIIFYLDSKKNQFKNISLLNNNIFDTLKLFSIGGKGVRGGLFIETARMFGFADKNTLLNIAATLEILHASLLIHDDIMDNDESRRGNTSIYAQYIPVGTSIGSINAVDFGKSMGICSGDIGFFIALDLFNEAVKNSEHDDLYQTVFHELITVVLGQMDDITFSHSSTIPKIEDIISMYTFKTAHYTFSLPFVLAAKITNQSQIITESLEKIGVDIGILFQIKDDEIGLFATEDTIGKPIGSDIRENKKTILRSFLENSMNMNEKNTLNSILKKTDISSEDIQKILDIYKKYNVKKFTKKIIDDYYSRATNAIHTINISNAHKNLLLNLTDYVVERTS